MFVRILMFLTLLLCQAASAQVITDTNCNQTTCKYNLSINESGFYIFNSSLQPESEYGLWDLSVESQSEPLGDASLYFGGKVTSNEKTTAFVSFYLNQATTLDLRVSDYTDSISQFKIKMFRQLDAHDGKGIGESALRSMVGNVNLPVGETEEIGTFSKGHYFLTVTASGNNTQVNAKIGGKLSGLKLANKITTGGQLGDEQSATAYDAYMARNLTPGNYVIKTRFGTAKDARYCGQGMDCHGAGQPQLTVKKTTPDGTRDIITSSESVFKLGDPSLSEDFVVTHMEASDYHSVLVYSLHNPSSGAVKVIVYDRDSKSYREIFHEAPEFDGESHAISDLAISADGSTIAFADSAIEFNDINGSPVLNGVLYIYDVITQTTTVLEAELPCGSNCSEVDGPIESLSLDASGRFLIYEPYFNYVQLYDRDTGEAESLQDLDFSYVQNLTLSNDASYLVFSSNAADFTGGDPSIQKAVFIKDLTGNGEITMISVSADNSPMPGVNYMPQIGANDDYILFSSNVGPVMALYLYDFNKGYAEKIINTGTGSQYSIDESGQTLIFSSRLDFDVPKLDDRFRLWSYDLAQQSLKLKASSFENSLQNPLLSADGRNLLFLENQLTADQDEIDNSHIWILNKQPAQFNIRIE